MTSIVELTLAAQLEQAHIPFEREYEFAPEEWCRQNGFLSPKRQLPRKWRADFAIYEKDGTNAWIGPHRGPAYAGISPLLVEVDGGGFIAGRHSRGTGMENDAEKASAAAILGYRVIRCTPRQVEDGRCLSWVRAALGMEERAA